MTKTSISQIRRPSNIQDVLSRLENCREITPRKWTADCPCTGHKTPKGHLAVDDTSDKAIVKCFNTHGYEEICQTLGYDSLTYSRISSSR